MLEKHHIVFRSQGGLDFELNYKYLTLEQHKGNKGLHLSRKTDLKYKKELQKKLEKILHNNYYTIEELIELLGLKKKQAYKAFRKLPFYTKGIKRDDIVKRLMGGRFYL